MGPLIINSLLCIVLCFPAFIPIRVFHIHDSLSGILIWLGISIGMHAFPSSMDTNLLWQHALQVARRWNPLALVSFPLVILLFVANVVRLFWFHAIYACAIGLTLPELVLKRLF